MVLIYLHGKGLRHLVHLIVKNCRLTTKTRNENE